MNLSLTVFILIMACEEVDTAYSLQLVFARVSPPSPRTFLLPSLCYLFRLFTTHAIYCEGLCLGEESCKMYAMSTFSHFTICYYSSHKVNF